MAEKRFGFRPDGVFQFEFSTGYKISIGMGWFHYCEPRPSGPPKDIMEYSERNEVEVAVFSPNGEPVKLLGDYGEVGWVEADKVEGLIHYLSGGGSSRRRMLAILGDNTFNLPIAMLHLLGEEIRGDLEIAEVDIADLKVEDAERLYKVALRPSDVKKLCEFYEEEHLLEGDLVEALRELIKHYA